MIVLASPFPCFSNVFKKTRKSNVIDDLYFFPLGRDALLSGLIALGLQRGDSIIIPAYMCGSAIQPLKDYGFDIIFIDVDEKLNLSVEIVQKVVNDNNIKALLVVHYFGFTKDFDEVIDICHKSDIKVVEDCTHSFLSQLSRDKQNIKSDMEIFSMRKTLPIQDGGALRIKNTSDKVFQIECDKCEVPFSANKYLIKNLIWKVIVSLRVNIYGLFITQLKGKVNNADVKFKHNINTKPCIPSQQLQQHLSNQYLNKIKLRINANFTYLSIKIKKLGLKLLVESILGNIIPKAVVIYDNKGGLVDYLRKNGIGAGSWPDYEIPLEVLNNQKNYPNAIYFNKTLVLLPIHQDINNKQCDYIVEILSKWKDEIIKEENNA